jgi:hypothetical protein
MSLQNVSLALRTAGSVEPSGPIKGGAFQDRLSYPLLKKDPVLE